MPPRPGAPPGRLVNGGQSCIGAKRFIVHEDVYEEWLDAFTERVGAAVIGDPLDESTTLGPLARCDLRDELHDQVTSFAGGRRAAASRGPAARTIRRRRSTVHDPDRGAARQAAWIEELFGPVAAVVRVSSTDEAIELANRSAFGLGGAVYTGDVVLGTTHRC